MANRHMRRSAVSAGRVLFPIQKTTWKAGESEVICLHGGLRLCRPYIGRMAICHIRVVVYEPSIQKRQRLLIINGN